MWTDDATGPHHKSESDHAPGQGTKEIRGEERFLTGPQTNVSLKVPRACLCERKNKSKVGNHHNVVGQNGVHRKALKS